MPGTRSRAIGIFFIFYFLFFILPASADDCLKYKTLPSLEIKVPRFSVSVSQPPRPLNLLHGNVVATFAEEYEVEYGVQKSGGGFCVFVQKIVASVGYTDFDIQIDVRHRPGSCEFNATKDHENEHIRAHLSVVDEGMDGIRKSVAAAANDILPVFLETEDMVAAAMDEIEKELQDTPQIKLMRQTLQAEQEMRNKKIDLDDRGWRISKCGE
jgi:hypothetical protein